MSYKRYTQGHESSYCFGHSLNYSLNTSQTSSNYSSLNNSYSPHDIGFYSACKKDYSLVTGELMHSSVIAETFLEDNRPVTPVISDTGDVKEVIETAFRLITHQEFPWADIVLKIMPLNDIKRVHASIGGFWSDGIMGFSINNYGKGVSEIYIKEQELDSLLLTIGHEIGHVLSPTLMNAHSEEAKAHAFSIAWV